MGSNQFSSCSSRCDLNGESYIPEPNFDLLSTEKYTLEDLKLIKINGIQIGINNPIDNDSIQEPIYNSNGADSSAPPLINFSQGISGALPDIDEIGKKNYLHCFCLLEAEKLEEKNKGIFIEFGEYDSGNDINDFKVKTFYQSKLGGLRLYVVNENLFENYCQLVRIKCKIEKNEELDDILDRISIKYKWIKDNYDRKNQNSIDFVVELLKYLKILNFEICKGIREEIPDKILDVLDNNKK